MRERAIAFSCRGDSLIGILHEPEAKARDLGILVVVGGPQYRVGSHRQFVMMARALAAAGHPVFRFDYGGMGDSSGEPRTFESVEADIRAAIDAFAAGSVGLRGFVIFGLCDAASAALMYCPTDTRVQRLILVNPWVRTESGAARALMWHYYPRRLLQRSFWQKILQREFNAVESVQGYASSLRRMRRSRGASASADVARHYLDRMQDGLTSFRGKTLVLLSANDLTAREFEDYCRSKPAWERRLNQPDVRRVVIAGADHTFSARHSLQEATSAILDWLSAEPDGWTRTGSNQHLAAYRDAGNA